MSQKRRAGEITEWRRGVGLLGPTSGAEFPLRDGLFSVLRGIYPYKPHVGAFVGEDVSDMFDIAYRDMFDTVPVASFDFHVGGSIVGQMVFGLTPRPAGGMKKPLVKVRLASGFSYVGHQGSVDGAGTVSDMSRYRDMSDTSSPTNAPTCGL